MVKIFFALAMAGLCFGQWIKPEIDPCHPEPVSGSKLLSQGMYLNPLNQWDNLTVRNLQAYSQRFNVTPFPPTLMMQVEGETLQSKSSFWKQAGIYGLEFVGAGVGSCASFYLGISIWGPTITREGYLSQAYLGLLIQGVSGCLFPSTLTWYVGGCLNQKGSWIKSLIGSSVGSIITLWSVLYAFEHSDVYPIVAGMCLQPTLAVIGYNW